MAACVDSLTKILKNYLSHVLYIDDEFKVAWRRKVDEEVQRPPRSSRHKVVQEERESVNSGDRATMDNLAEFCTAVREEYPEILLTPVVYRDSIDVENLVVHMKNARLLVIDWKLSDKVTAIQLLNRQEFFGQLRFCVIYTSRLEEAEREFVSSIPNVKDAGLKNAVFNGYSYDYVRINSIIYMICEKDKFDFHMIIDSLTEIFVSEIGYFPIAFIDMIARLEEKVPFYLNEFSYPFDNLLMLQTNSDGLPLSELSYMINDMVINNIRSDIELNDKVLDGIYEKQIGRLRDLLKEDGRFQDRLNESLEYIFDRLGCKEEERKIFENISAGEYKTTIQKAINKPEDLSKGIHKASDSLARLYARKKVESVIPASDNLSPDMRKVKSELVGLYKQQIQNKIEKLFPVCLMILSNPKESYDLNRLVTSLKVVKYPEDKREFSDIFIDCYECKDEYMCLKSQENGSPLGFLQNKLNVGDVFYLRTEQGQKEKFYLCIVPSCHLLRPKKVEGILLFVEGKVVDEKPDNTLKDSEHFTILPGINDRQMLVRIVWQFHRIYMLDLNRVARKDYENFCRPYRLTNEYFRQIMGEFVSFYSKSGVEELFLKGDSALDQLLLQSKESDE